ncbi:MAG: hypothetical protein ABJF01_21385 [bacterium]
MNFICAGRTLLLRDRRMGAHLWFVLTDPDAETHRVVIVAVVTERAHTERTVRLLAGDHPFVRHASNVDFGTATYAPASKLEAALADNRGSLSDDMSNELLERVRRGLLASSHTPNDIVAHCAVAFKR